MDIRILIIDDHRLFRVGIKALLSADTNLSVVGEATSGEDGLQAAQNLTPDVILMDIGLPGIDGLEVTRRLIVLLPNTKILVITMYEDSELVRECIRAGAAGYIIKRASEAELVDAIYAVWRGIIYIHPTLIPSVISPPLQKEVQSSAEIGSLSNREVEVLGLIKKGIPTYKLVRG